MFSRLSIFITEQNLVVISAAVHDMFYHWLARYDALCRAFMWKQDVIGKTEST